MKALLLLFKMVPFLACFGQTVVNYLHFYFEVAGDRFFFAAEGYLCMCVLLCCCCCC
jgi:hypothetical protein